MRDAHVMNGRSGQDKMALSYAILADGQHMDCKSEAKLRSIAGDIEPPDHTVPCEASGNRFNSVLNIDEVFNEVSCLVVGILIHEM